MPRKRERKASPKSSAKKQKVVHREQHEIDCDAVQEVLREYLEVDSHLGGLIADGVAQAFQQYKSERHEFFGQVVDLASEALQFITQDAETKKAAAQDMTDNAENIRLGYETKLEQTQKTLEKNEEILAQKEQVKVQHEEANDAAKENLDTKQDALDECIAALGRLEKALADAERKNSDYVTVRDSPAENAKELKKDIDSAVSLFKKMGMETSLLVAAPKALSRQVDERGAFDKTVIAEVNSQIEEFLRKQKSTISDSAAERQVAETAVAHADTVFKNTTAVLEKTTEEIENVECEIEGLKSESKTLAKNIKDHGKNLAKNEANHGRLGELLELLQETRTKFESLCERDVPVEPEAPEAEASEPEAKDDQTKMNRQSPSMSGSAPTEPTSPREAAEADAGQVDHGDEW